MRLCSLSSSGITFCQEQYRTTAAVLDIFKADILILYLGVHADRNRSLDSIAEKKMLDSACPQHLQTWYLWTCFTRSIALGPGIIVSSFPLKLLK